ncbi:hypothetical protein CYMTET_51422, partial [Cymbomonas tetramitiformis]
MAITAKRPRAHVGSVKHRRWGNTPYALAAVGYPTTANPKTKRSKSFKKGINQRPPMQSRKERPKEQAEKEARGEGVTALPSEPSIDALAKTSGPRESLKCARSLNTGGEREILEFAIKEPVEKTCATVGIHQLPCLFDVLIQNEYRLPLVLQA